MSNSSIPEPQILYPDGPHWPSILDGIASPPEKLWVSGILAPERASIAIVGSRRASTSGLRISFEVAAELTRAGFRVVSGLAHGIDRAALEGALHGGGQPLALLGNGLPAIYPAANRDLAAKIITAGGSLVTEYKPGTPPRRGNFPRRNRLISGWSLGVILVEAAIKSGSMGTARHALEQGREIFAFPGSVEGGRNDGCHVLIQDGAYLVTGADEILEIFAGLGPKRTSSDDGKKLEQLAREHGPDLDQLLEVTGWSPVRLLKAWSHRDF